MPKATEDQTEKRKIARILARVLFSQSWNAEHPDSTPQERQKAFEEVQTDFRKAARKTLKIMERQGVEMTLRADDTSDSEA